MRLQINPFLILSFFYPNLFLSPATVLSDSCLLCCLSSTVSLSLCCLVVLWLSLHGLRAQYAFYCFCIHIYLIYHFTEGPTKYKLCFSVGSSIFRCTRHKYYLILNCYDKYTYLPITLNSYFKLLCYPIYINVHCV